MFSLIVGEYFDEEKNEFVNSETFELKLEHSLLSISKWEAIWKKPFLHTIDEKTGQDTKTKEQTVSYVRCMTLNKNVPEYIYDIIGDYEFKRIQEYINTDQTATWFSNESSGARNRTIVTSELIYYWMTAHQIPFEAQKWHLSRLYTLIKICNANNSPQKKMSKTEVMRRNREMNEARKAALNSKG